MCAQLLVSLKIRMHLCSSMLQASWDIVLSINLYKCTPACAQLSVSTICPPPPLSPLDLDKSHKYQQLSIFQIRLWLPLPFYKFLHLLHKSNPIWILNKYKPTIFQKCKKRMFFRLVVLRGCRGRYSSETPEDD